MGNGIDICLEINDHTKMAGANVRQDTSPSVDDSLSMDLYTDLLEESHPEKPLAAAANNMDSLLEEVRRLRRENERLKAEADETTKRRKQKDDELFHLRKRVQECGCSHRSSQAYSHIDSCSRSPKKYTARQGATSGCPRKKRRINPELIVKYTESSQSSTSNPPFTQVEKGDTLHEYLKLFPDRSGAFSQSQAATGNVNTVFSGVTSQPERSRVIGEKVSEKIDTSEPAVVEKNLLGDIQLKQVDNVICDTPKENDRTQDSESTIEYGNVTDQSDLAEGDCVQIVPTQSSEQTESKISISYSENKDGSKSVLSHCINLCAKESAKVTLDKNESESIKGGLKGQSEYCDSPLEKLSDGKNETKRCSTAIEKRSSPVKSSSGKSEQHKDKQDNRTTESTFDPVKGVWADVGNTATTPHRSSRSSSGAHSSTSRKDPSSHKKSSSSHDQIRQSHQRSSHSKDHRSKSSEKDNPSHSKGHPSQEKHHNVCKKDHQSSKSYPASQQKLHSCSKKGHSRHQKDHSNSEKVLTDKEATDKPTQMSPTSVPETKIKSVQTGHISDPKNKDKTKSPFTSKDKKLIQNRRKTSHRSNEGLKGDEHNLSHSRKSCHTEGKRENTHEEPSKIKGQSSSAEAKNAFQKLRVSHESRSRSKSPDPKAISKSTKCQEKQVTDSQRHEDQEDVSAAKSCETITENQKAGQTLPEAIKRSSRSKNRKNSTDVQIDIQKADSVTTVQPSTSVQDVEKHVKPEHAKSRERSSSRSMSLRHRSKHPESSQKPESFPTEAVEANNGPQYVASSIKVGKHVAVPKIPSSSTSASKTETIKEHQRLTCNETSKKGHKANPRTHRSKSEDNDKRVVTSKAVSTETTQKDEDKSDRRPNKSEQKDVLSDSNKIRQGRSNGAAGRLKVHETSNKKAKDLPKISAKDECSNKVSNNVSNENSKPPLCKTSVPSGEEFLPSSVQLKKFVIPKVKKVAVSMENTDEAKDKSVLEHKKVLSTPIKNQRQDIHFTAHHKNNEKGPSKKGRANDSKKTSKAVPVTVTKDITGESDRPVYPNEIPQASLPNKLLSPTSFNKIVTQVSKELVETQILKKQVLDSQPDDIDNDVTNEPGTQSKIAARDPRVIAAKRRDTIKGMPSLMDVDVSASSISVSKLVDTPTSQCLDLPPAAPCDSQASHPPGVQASQPPDIQASQLVCGQASQIPSQPEVGVALPGILQSLLGKTKAPTTVNTFSKATEIMKTETGGENGGIIGTKMYCEEQSEVKITDNVRGGSANGKHLGAKQDSRPSKKAEIPVAKPTRTTYPLPKPTRVLPIATDAERLLAYTSLSARRNKGLLIEHKRCGRAEQKRRGARRPEKTSEHLEGEAMYGGARATAGLSHEAQRDENPPPDFTQELSSQELEELWNQGVDVTDPEVLASFMRLRSEQNNVQAAPLPHLATEVTPHCSHEVLNMSAQPSQHIPYYGEPNQAAVGYGAPDTTWSFANTGVHEQAVEKTELVKTDSSFNLEKRPGVNKDGSFYTKNDEVSGSSLSTKERAYSSTMVIQDQIRSPERKGTVNKHDKKDIGYSQTANRVNVEQPQPLDLSGKEDNTCDQLGSREKDSVKEPKGHKPKETEGSKSEEQTCAEEPHHSKVLNEEEGVLQMCSHKEETAVNEPDGNVSNEEERPLSEIQVSLKEPLHTNVQEKEERHCHPASSQKEERAVSEPEENISKETGRLRSEKQVCLEEDQHPKSYENKNRGSGTLCSSEEEVANELVVSDEVVSSCSDKQVCLEVPQPGNVPGTENNECSQRTEGQCEAISTMTGGLTALPPMASAVPLQPRDVLVPQFPQVENQENNTENPPESNDQLDSQGSVYSVISLSSGSTEPLEAPDGDSEQVQESDVNRESAPCDEAHDFKASPLLKLVEEEQCQSRKRDHENEEHIVHPAKKLRIDKLNIELFGEDSMQCSGNSCDAIVDVPKPTQIDEHIVVSTASESQDQENARFKDQKKKMQLELELFGEDSIQVSMSSWNDTKENTTHKDISQNTTDNASYQAQPFNEEKLGVKEDQEKNTRLHNFRLGLCGKDSMQVSKSSCDVDKDEKASNLSVNTEGIVDKVISEPQKPEHEVEKMQSENPDQNEKEDESDLDLDVGDSEFSIDPANVRIEVDVDVSGEDSVDSSDSWNDSAFSSTENDGHVIIIDNVLSSSADISDKPAVPDRKSNTNESSFLGDVMSDEKGKTSAAHPRTETEKQLPNKEGEAASEENCDGQERSKVIDEVVGRKGKVESETKKTTNTVVPEEVINVTDNKSDVVEKCTTLESGKVLNVSGESTIDPGDTSDGNSDGACGGDEMSEDLDLTLKSESKSGQGDDDVSDSCSSASVSGGSSLHCESNTDDDLDDMDEQLVLDDSHEKTLCKEDTTQPAKEEELADGGPECFGDVLELHAADDLSMFDEESQPASNVTPKRKTQKKICTSTPRSPKSCPTPKSLRLTPKKARSSSKSVQRALSLSERTPKTRGPRTPLKKRERQAPSDASAGVEEGEVLSDVEDRTPKSRGQPRSRESDRSKRRRTPSRERDGKRVRVDVRRSTGGSSRRYQFSASSSSSSHHNTPRDSKITPSPRSSHSHHKRSRSPERISPGSGKRPSRRSESYSRRDPHKDPSKDSRRSTEQLSRGWRRER